MGKKAPRKNSGWYNSAHGVVVTTWNIKAGKASQTIYRFKWLVASGGKILRRATKNPKNIKAKMGITALITMLTMKTYLFKSYLNNTMHFTNNMT